MRKQLFVACIAFIALLLGAVFMTSAVFALGVPPRPPLDRPVVDTTGTLSPQQIDSLSAAINKSRTEKAYQVGVLIVPSLENESIDDFSLNVARTWGIGDTTNNGVLLLIAKNDRLIRIEVGSGLEGDLTDAESGRIIRSVIAPEFRKGNYYQGIGRAVESIQAQIEHRPEAGSSMRAVSSSGLLELLFPVVFFGLTIVAWFVSLLARSRSWWAGGMIGGVIGLIFVLSLSWTIYSIVLAVGITLLGLLLDWIVSRNFYYHTAAGKTPSWWAGGAWIDNGGGDYGGGFGGGGFSGGGASGSW